MEDAFLSGVSFEIRVYAVMDQDDLDVSHGPLQPLFNNFCHTSELGNTKTYPFPHARNTSNDFQIAFCCASHTLREDLRGACGM